jgi:hypothetical protein
LIRSSVSSSSRPGASPPAAPVATAGVGCPWGGRSAAAGSRPGTAVAGFAGLVFVSAVIRLAAVFPITGCLEVSLLTGCLEVSLLTGCVAVAGTPPGASAGTGCRRLLLAIRAGARLVSVWPGALALFPRYCVVVAFDDLAVVDGATPALNLVGVQHSLRHHVPPEVLELQAGPPTLGTP